MHRGHIRVLKWLIKRVEIIWLLLLLVLLLVLLVLVLVLLVLVLKLVLLLLKMLRLHGVVRIRLPRRRRLRRHGTCSLKILGVRLALQRFMGHRRAKWRRRIRHGHVVRLHLKLCLKRLRWLLWRQELAPAGIGTDLALLTRTTTVIVIVPLLLLRLLRRRWWRWRRRRP